MPALSLVLSVSAYPVSSVVPVFCVVPSIYSRTCTRNCFAHAAKGSVSTASGTSVAAEEPPPAVAEAPSPDVVETPTRAMLEKSRRRRSSIHFKVLGYDLGGAAHVESAELPTARRAPPANLNIDHSGRSLCSEEAPPVSPYVGVRDTNTQTPEFRRLADRKRALFCMVVTLLLREPIIA